MADFNSSPEERKAMLKKLFLKLQSGESEEAVRQELINSMSGIPYHEVVEVEEELISEGMPISELLKLCDAHSAVLHGHIDLDSVKEIPECHPVDVFIKENIELKKVTMKIKVLIEEIETSKNFDDTVLKLRAAFNQLYDVDKHYQRKEYLLFPFLERLGFAGPPKVMWGKHDEIRGYLKNSIRVLQTPMLTKEKLLPFVDKVLFPAINGVDDMMIKETEILFPMALEALSDSNWSDISRQSLEFGYCLYDPPREWMPEGTEKLTINEMQKSGANVQLPTGTISAEELHAILNALPVDMTFVNKDDKVKYFSQSKDRIFQRNRAILNRDVRLCHPPSSAHIVDKIIEDFRSGKEDRAPFWIKLGDKFVLIEYFALRNEKGEYLGTLEVSQDISEHRALEGEQRILSYTKEKE